MNSSKPGAESKAMAERLSALCKNGITGLPDDLRYTYTKAGFLVVWGGREEEAKTCLLSFDQLRNLDNEHIEDFIRRAHHE